MIVFSAFMKIVKKNIGICLVYFGVFIGVTFLMMSSADEVSVASFEQARVEVGVINHDSSEVAILLKRYLAETQDLVEIEDDMDQLQTAMFFRKISYLVVIPEGFGDSLLHGEDNLLEITKVPNSYAGIFVDLKINQFISILRGYMSAGFSENEAMDATMKNLDQDVKTTIQLEQGKISKRHEFAGSFQYMSYCLIACIVTIVGSILLAFGKPEVALRTKCSATPLRNRNLQMALGCVTISTLLWGLMLCLPMALYGKEIIDSGMLGYLLLNTGTFAVFCIGLAYLLGSLSKNEMQLSGIATSCSLAFSFLGGVFVPLSLMSDQMQSFSKIIPSYWYVRANDILSASTFLTKESKEDFFQSILIQVLFSVAFFSIALVVNKRRNERQ